MVVSYSLNCRYNYLIRKVVLPYPVIHIYGYYLSRKVFLPYPSSDLE